MDRILSSLRNTIVSRKIPLARVNCSPEFCEKTEVLSFVEYLYELAKLGKERSHLGCAAGRHLAAE
jgi:hypothetical protein